MRGGIRTLLMSPDKSELNGLSAYPLRRTLFLAIRCQQVAALTRFLHASRMNIVPSLRMESLATIPSCQTQRRVLSFTCSVVASRNAFYITAHWSLSLFDLAADSQQ